MGQVGFAGKKKSKAHRRLSPTREKKKKKKCAYISRWPRRKERRKRRRNPASSIFLFRKRKRALAAASNRSHHPHRGRHLSISSAQLRERGKTSHESPPPLGGRGEVEGAPAETKTFSPWLKEKEGVHRKLKIDSLVSLQALYKVKKREKKVAESAQSSRCLRRGREEETGRRAKTRMDDFVRGGKEKQGRAQSL